MATRTCALAVALAVVLALAGCTDQKSDEERAVAALRADMVADAGMTTRRPVDDRQTGCVAKGMVDTLGLETLQHYGLLTDELRAGEPIEGVELKHEDADALAEVFAGCMDLESLMEREIVSGLDLSGRRKQRAAGCVRDTVTAEQVRRSMALELRGARNSVVEQLRGDLESCLR
jgi:hypothetical protein